jgi:tetratricopeptide (TPR) repeat protein
MNCDRPVARALDWTWRAALTAALACAALSAARAGVGAWYARRGGTLDLERAMRWAPDNAANDAALARLDELGGGAEGQARALQLRERATLLEPGNAIFWLERAMSEDEAGMAESAGPDYMRARELFPLSPDVNRALGEYYLRQGRIDDALDALRFAIAGDPEMRPAVFGELWRAGVDAREVLARGVPPDPDVLLAYLDALAAVGALDDAQLVWTQLVALGEIPAQDAIQHDAFEQGAFQYVDALIRFQKTSELEEVWEELAPEEATAARTAGNLISNGSFEQPMLNEGLDWRVYPVDGVFVSLDATQAHDGARALRIDFTAPGNLAYQHTFEFVPVESDTEYEFTGYLRAADVTSDSGPRFELYDAANPQNLNLATADIRGITDWTAERLRFRTSPDTHLLIVRVGRPPSTSFDNRLSGTVWVDDVRLAKAAN